MGLTLPERRIVMVKRSDFLVFVQPAARRGSWTWFDLADVSELKSGEKGWYEIERIPGPAPRARKWRVIGPAPCPILPSGPC